MGIGTHASFEAAVARERQAIAEAAAERLRRVDSLLDIKLAEGRVHIRAGHGSTDALRRAWKAALCSEIVILRFEGQRAALREMLFG